MSAPSRERAQDPRDHRPVQGVPAHLRRLSDGGDITRKILADAKKAAPFEAERTPRDSATRGTNRRVNLDGRPWSTHEITALRGHYVARGSVFLSGLLGRTARSVQHKAQKLGLSRWPRWSDIEHRKLRNQWGVCFLGEIALALGRTKRAVFNEGRAMGLRPGASADEELIGHAAERMGLCPATLLRILAGAGVSVAPPAASFLKGCRRRRELCAARVDIDEAVAAWLETETVGAAARARGVSWYRMTGMLARAGVTRPSGHKGRKWRVPSAAIDRALAAGREAA